MSGEDESGISYEEQRSGILGIFSFSVVAIVSCLSLLADGFLWLSSAKFARIFQEMLENEPLPAITAFTIAATPYYCMLDLILCAVCVVFIFKKRNRDAIALSATIGFLVVIKFFLSIYAFFLPLITIVKNLGAK